MSVNVYEEQRLYTTSEEREAYEALETLYCNIVCLDQIERLYIRGSVHDEEYAPACTRLIGQCKTAAKLLAELRGSVPRFTDIPTFMRHYGVRFGANRWTCQQPRTDLRLAFLPQSSMRMVRHPATNMREVSQRRRRTLSR